MTDGAGTALRHELARKAIHLASAVVPLAYALGTPRRMLLLALAALAIVALSVEAARHRWARAQAAFVRAVGPLLRAHEHTRFAGATWLVVAYAASVVLFPRAIAVAAMCAAAFGDASAAIVGRAASVARAQRTGMPSAGKTFAGSAACATITTIAAYGIAGLSVPTALATGVVASVAERWAIVRVDDNVRVALAAGYGAWASDALAHLLVHL